MTIPSFKLLKKNAAQRLEAAPQQRQIGLAFFGAATVLPLLVTLISHYLDLQIAKTGGLGGMGLRSILSTIQSVLPMLQSILLICLELGYLAAMLRISREQHTSLQTLKLGFDRFWVLLRYYLMEGFLYMMAGFAAIWVGVQLYLLTPLSDPLMDYLEPIMAAPGFTVDGFSEMLMDGAFLSEVTMQMIPMFLIAGVLYLLIFIPIHYSLRMGKYVLIDKPGYGAAFALRESRKMMKGSRLRLFKLDVSLWWWYLLGVLTMVLCYGDSLLGLLGIALPWSDTVNYFLFYGLYLAAQFALWYGARNRVEVVYAQVYNALKPREKDNGVVLGNIFQM